MGTVIANSSATTSGACGCCGTLEAATLQCRTRGGTAALCGYSEFTSPSTPPKKYRVKTYTSNQRRCNYLTTDCSGSPQGSDGSNWDLVCTVNVATCNTSTTGAIVTLQDIGSCPASTVIGNITDCTISRSPSDASANFDFTWTPTQTQRTANPGCTGPTGSSLYSFATGTETIALSVEDTNQDAIDRLLAGAGGTWGSWLTPGASGCTGTPPPCCLARWEERTSDFDFVYVESEYRVTASGLSPSTTYGARVEIYRSVFGANSYSLFQTLIVNGTTDGSGNFSEDGAVPNEEGFESYAAAAYIVIPP